MAPQLQREGTGDHRPAAPTPRKESAHHRVGDNRDVWATISARCHANEDLQCEHHRRKHVENDYNKDGYRSNATSGLSASRGAQAFTAQLPLEPEDT